MPMEADFWKIIVGLAGWLVSIRGGRFEQRESGGGKDEGDKTALCAV